MSEQAQRGVAAVRAALNGSSRQSRDTRLTRVVVADDSEGRIEVECRPFEPDMPDYDGQRFLAIHVDGREESFVCLSAVQAGELASLLVGEPAAS